MAERATKRSMAALAGDWLDEAKQSDLRADRIRAVIESAPGGDRAAERADATAADGRGTRSRKGRGGIKRRARQR
jgi:hypothetical protein